MTPHRLFERISGELDDRMEGASLVGVSRAILEKVQSTTQTHDKHEQFTSIINRMETWGQRLLEIIAKTPSHPLTKASGVIPSPQFGTIQIAIDYTLQILA